MARIHSLSIKNFRGIKQFSQIFGESNFICLIGRGDSGKSTILDAISYVLSPSWNLSFYDTDFFNTNISEPIEIETTLSNLPEELLTEDKYGLWKRGLKKETNKIFDELEDNHETVLTIKLVVTDNLEPKWYIVNERRDLPKEISAYDRAKLNVFIISDSIDRQFSWSKGNPLYTLLKQEKNEDTDDENIIINALREAKKNIDDASFKQFENIISKIKTASTNFGIDITNTTTSIDFKDISIKDNRVCLHDEKIPFRLKGKGSKRLISIAIQAALTESSGIILIDEIEQGLEPDRVMHLVNTLKKNNSGQIFITTHSSNVLVELAFDDLFLLKKGSNELITHLTQRERKVLNFW